MEEEEEEEKGVWPRVLWEVLCSCWYDVRRGERGRNA